MTRFCFLICFLALTLPEKVFAQQIDWDQTQREIFSVFQEVKNRWGVSGEAAFPDSMEIQALPKSSPEEPAVVEFGRQRVLRRLQPLPSNRRGMYIRWMVAHELWHRYQLERSGEVLDQRVTNPQRECEADVAGAWFAGQKVISEITLDIDASTTDRIRDTLLELRESVDPQVGLDEIGDTYPDLEQRRMAIRFGISRAMFDFVTSSAIIGQAGAAAAARNLKQGAMIDERPFHEWASLVCSRSVHSGLAVRHLRFSSPVIRWNNSSADNNTVEFSQVVQNRSDKKVRLFLGALTSSALKVDRSNTKYWNPIDAMNFERDLEPFEAITVRGALDWAFDVGEAWGGQRSDYMPILLLPGLRTGDPGVLFNAEPIVANVNTAGLESGASELAAFLSKVAATAPSNFESLSCDFTDSTQRCYLQDIPARFARGQFRKQTSGGPDLILPVYSGSSSNEADRYFRELERDLRAIYPGAQFTIDSSSGRQPSVKDRFLLVEGIDSIKLNLLSFVLGEGDDTEFDVTLYIDPSR